MMHAFRSHLKHLPIRHQLVLIVMLATSVSTLGGFGVVLIDTMEVLRAKELERLIHVARIVADSSVAPLAFDDPEGAAERLAYLQGVPGVIAATVWDASGTEFSRWARPPVSSDEQAEQGIPADHIGLELPLLVEGKQVGHAEIVASTESVEAEVRGQALYLAGIMAAVVLIALAIAYWLQRVVTEPIRNLAAVTREVSRTGDYPLPESLSVDSSREIRELYASFGAMFRRIAQREQERDRIHAELSEAQARLEQRVGERTRELLEANAELRAQVAERQRTQSQLQRLLGEKEVLVREIHHRVKNNLYVVYSLLSLQAAEIRDTGSVQALTDCRQRVKTMAIVHETLLQARDMARIEADRFASRIVHDLQLVYAADASRVAMRTELESFVLSIEQAIPVGLILNELLSNAFKYAFPGERHGSVEVMLCQLGEDEIVLEVGDDGVGMPHFSEPAEQRSLGLQLVDSLAKQLGGTLTMERRRGTHYRIVFQQRMG